MELKIINSLNTYVESWYIMNSGLHEIYRKIFLSLMKEISLLSSEQSA